MNSGYRVSLLFAALSLRRKCLLINYTCARYLVLLIELAGIGIELSVTWNKGIVGGLLLLIVRSGGFKQFILVVVVAGWRA